METIKFEKKKQNIKELIYKGYSAASKSHKFLFSDKNKLTIALAYLTEANTFFTTAKTLCVQDEDLDRQEFETLFHKFYVYNKEFLNNVATDHSHQWSDIEFIALSEAYESAKNLLG